MAERESSGSSWLGFIAAILLLGVIGLGIYTYTGNMQRETASLEVNLPEPPEVDLPEAPVVPPTANESQ